MGSSGGEAVWLEGAKSAEHISSIPAGFDKYSIAPTIIDDTALAILPNPVSINELQHHVWSYNSDLETHTVETHIYRLRKKINDKFMDTEFIFNNKEGYYL